MNSGKLFSMIEKIYIAIMIFRLAVGLFIHLMLFYLIKRNMREAFVNFNNGNETFWPETCSWV